MKLHHAHDHVQLDDVVDLFDGDRQKGFLETLFRDDDFNKKQMACAFGKFLLSLPSLPGDLICKIIFQRFLKHNSGRANTGEG